MEGGPSIQEVENATQSVSTIAEPEEQSGCIFTCCNPRSGLHRFIALIFMCFLGFGSYFCYDNPAALEDYIKSDLNISVTQYVMLYSIYSWPNVILCFLGGFLIDRVFGIRLGTNIFMALTLVGQLLFASGVFFNLYWIMIFGRFVFGIGAESLAVAQNNYAVLWFKGKELNMVFGLQLSFARVGSAVNFLVMDSIYRWINESVKGAHGLGIVLYIATLTCLISMACALILGLMDKRAERILRRYDDASPEIVRLTDVKYFSAPFWLITLICVSYYVAIFPFIGLSKDFFMSRFHISSKKANFINSTVYLLSAFISPILGLLIDKIGKNIFWILVAIALTIGAHSIMAFTFLNPFVGMIAMGIAYSCLASSLWPLVSLIIPEHQLGTAYGICQAIQNLGLAVFTIVTGIIVNHFGYTWLEIFFISSLIVAFITTIILWLLNMKRKGTLNMTPNERRQFVIPTSNDRDQIFPANDETVGGSTNDVSFRQNSDFEIRNRYLSKIGAPLPDHYCIDTKSLNFKN